MVSIIHLVVIIIPWRKIYLHFIYNNIQNNERAQSYPVRKQWNGRRVKEWPEDSYLKLPWAQQRALCTDSASHPSCRIRRGWGRRKWRRGHKKTARKCIQNTWLIKNTRKKCALRSFIATSSLLRKDRKTYNCTFNE